VSDACHSPLARFRSSRALNKSTSVWIVGVFGVSTTRLAGVDEWSTGEAAPTRTASVFAE